MQPIQANNYPIHFNEKGYAALNSYINENKYSNLFKAAQKGETLLQNHDLYEQSGTI